MSTQRSARRSEAPEVRRAPGVDQADLARAAAQDVGGFNRLVAHHWAAVASYSARLLQARPEVGEDVAQEVFLRIWAGEVSWSGDVSPRPFLLGIARNLCRNRRRHRSLRERVGHKLQHELQRLRRIPTPMDCLEESQLQQRLDRALAVMPPRRREVFLLVRMQGLSYANTAQVMGISPQTVANQLSSALEDLRSLL